MFGEQIKKLRQSHNLSQVQLAQNLGISKQSVCNWEHDYIMPSLDQLKHIAEFFGCTTDYLLELDNQRTFVETTHLTEEQSAHICQLIRDLENLNKQIQS